MKAGFSLKPKSSADYVGCHGNSLCVYFIVDITASHENLSTIIHETMACKIFAHFRNCSFTFPSEFYAFDEFREEYFGIGKMFCM
jgi:hypothetical protein